MAWQKYSTSSTKGLVMLHEQDASKGACFFNQVLQQAPAILREKYQVFRVMAIPLFDGPEHRSICLRHALSMMGAAKPPVSTLRTLSITRLTSSRRLDIAGSTVSTTSSVA